MDLDPTSPGLERRHPPAPIPFPDRAETEAQRRIRQRIEECREAQRVAEKLEAEQIIAAATARLVGLQPPPPRAPKGDGPLFGGAR